MSLVDVTTGDVASSAPIGMDSRFVAFGHGVARSRASGTTPSRRSRPAGLGNVRGGPRPERIAVTEDAVWIAHFWNDELWRLDPDTKEVEARIPLAPGAYDVEAGFGAIWVTSVDSRTITRVDPETNRVTGTFQLTFPAHELAVGEDALWATVRACGSLVYAC